MNKLKPITPGEILLEEFLKPMGLSQYRLAKEIGVPPQRISDIIAGKRAITADTDLRLCRFLGLSNGYWLRAQAAHDTEVAERELGAMLTKIKPWATTMAQQGAPADAKKPRRWPLPFGKVILGRWFGRIGNRKEAKMTTTDNIIREALTLRPSEKAKLIDRLISSLDKPDKEIDELWVKEVEDRIDAYDQGKLKAISLEKVLQKYR
jgi:addiction module HigA family antidote